MAAPLLDINSIEMLINSLPQLKLLGRLEGWNVTAQQVEVLRQKIIQENYDILLWYNLPMHLELNFDEQFVDL